MIGQLVSDSTNWWTSVLSTQINFFLTFCYLIIVWIWILGVEAWEEDYLVELMPSYSSQTDNVFSPSAQCIKAANMARRLIFMIRRSFLDLSKSAFIPIYGALVRPHLEYGMTACSADINHLERIQRFATRLVTGIRHLPYEERLQRLNLHSLQWRRLRADLITAFKILTGLLDIDLNLFFLPPARCGIRGHPYKVFQVASHRRRRGTAFSVGVVIYWNKLRASVVTAPSVNIFKKRFENVWTEVFPHLPHWLNPHLPISLIPLPHPTWTPSINSYHLFL